MTDDPVSGDSAPDDGHWRDLLDDAAAIASSYREQSYDVFTVSPRDVAPLLVDGTADAAVASTDPRTDDPSGVPSDVPSDDRPVGGLVVLAVDETIEELAEAVGDEGRRFDAATVYQRSIGDVVLAIAVELDTTRNVAVILPLYYRREEARESLEAACETGELRLRVRSADREDWLTFAHGDPGLFVPDEWGLE